MDKLVSFFRALGEETRIKIISMLLEEEMCICELIEKLNLSQSAVSHHVKILKQAELVNDRRQGKWNFYSINKAGFKKYLNLIDQELDGTLNNYEYKMKAEADISCPV